MKMKKWVLFVSILIGIVPILTYLATYPLLPAQIPTSYSFGGEITGYTSRNGVVWLMLLPLMLLPLFCIVPKIDPKGDKYNQIAGFYQGFIIGMTAFMSIMGVLTLWQTFHPESQALQRVIPIAIGILFVCIGNYMPKMKQNYTMGIKTPWTLENQVVWYKTHRLGGKCFTIGGIVVLVMHPFLADWAWLFVLVMIGVGVVPCVMSYVYYRQEMANK